MRLKMLLLIISGIIFSYYSVGQNPIRIMPMGNSITQGWTNGTITDDYYLAGYRYNLKTLLQNEGFSIDFVGSQSGGGYYFSDCQHAGIGGTRDQYVVRLLQDGFDVRNNVQILVPPRPYLDEYNPDIILLHIGTNDITHEEDAITNQQVMNILNMIDQYEARSHKEVVVFLARIINRMKPWVAGSGAATTTDFNNYIEQLALTRIANGDKIVIVDMENDAGLNYDNTDMADNLHPNAAGYLKMATLWKNSIIQNYNTAPVLTTIPNQTINEGECSNLISLDNYISDIQDADANITWTYQILESPNISVTLNANRQVTVTALDQNWNGSQKVVFTATDQGKNGKFIKSVSDTVLFTVMAVNDVPSIISLPPLSAIKGQLYTYNVSASDLDQGDVLQYSTLIKPDWLNFYPESKLLAGIPNQSGSFPVTIRISDGSANVDQSFNIQVQVASSNEDLNNENFSIFPNPASHYLIIKSEKKGPADFALFNMMGVQVLHKSIDSTGETNINLDSSLLHSGTYFYKTDISGEQFTGKLIIVQ